MTKIPRKSSSPLAAAVLTAFALSGCAISGEGVERFMVAPGKFALYTCPDLVTKAGELSKRQQELEGLIAKANEGAGGGLVSALAYRPDYLSVRGEMRDLQAAAAEKHCDLSGAGVAGQPAPP